MVHTTNTKGFIEVASVTTSPLLKAYCGLVAIELILKSKVSLSNHDVPSALTRLNTREPKAGGHSLISLAQQLRDEIDAINVTGKSGERRTAPHDCYPFIRYTTFDVDGWDAPTTTEDEMLTLAATVARIRQYLKKHYGFQL